VSGRIGARLTPPLAEKSAAQSLSSQQNGFG
jgi:hypothetical protein